MFYTWPEGEVFLLFPTLGGGRRGAANCSMRVANGGPGRSDAQSGGSGRARLSGFFYL